jgi:peroxiredoxin
MKKNFLLTAFVLFLALAGLSGQKVSYSSFGIDPVNGHIPTGLKSGDRAPDFTGYDQKGKQVTLKSFLEKGPVVLFFYRGNWCPACNKQLAAYQDSLNMITGENVSLVAITPESIEFVEQTVKLHNIGYTVVYDCQEKIMQDYDLMFNVTKDFNDLVLNRLKVNIAEHNGRDAAHLPVAATFIINKFGTITARYFDYDYHHRASVKWIMQNLSTVL